ncbi:MAG: BON domain-containing protein [Methyloversatilis sp.]|jgi:osmotically-inducible protein OsmY|nr:BON domain-containing protein [Methyloversatilis sp.]MBP6192825.1 BON domain-containing protein [Methyloversatilis sp.]MBP9116461.1 BON domain-containing protein [Methyloversatilis sp.]
MTRSTSPTSRFALVRPLALAAVLAACVPLLQGCFPVVAAGAGGAVLSALDRRTSGTQVEDEGIELRAGARLREKLGNRANINVTSYNRNVLLTGQVADEATRSEASAILAGVPNVRGVSNETEIAGVSSLTQRSSDALITSKVKARLLDAQRVSANHVKVVTEMGKVFLMGLLTETEAKAAKEIAAATGGVSKVVAIIEIVTPEEARRLDQAGGGR